MMQRLPRFTRRVTDFLPTGGPSGYDSKAALAKGEALRRLVLGSWLPDTRTVDAWLMSSWFIAAPPYVPPGPRAATVGVSLAMRREAGLMPMETSRRSEAGWGTHR